MTDLTQATQSQYVSRFLKPGTVKDLVRLSRNHQLKRSCDTDTAFGLSFPAHPHLRVMHLRHVETNSRRDRSMLHRKVPSVCNPLRVFERIHPLLTHSINILKMWGQIQPEGPSVACMRLQSGTGDNFSERIEYRKEPHRRCTFRRLAHTFGNWPLRSGDFVLTGSEIFQKESWTSTCSARR